MAQGIEPSRPGLPIDAITYRELLSTVAQKMGFGESDSDGMAAPPSDPGDRARCRQVVMRGLRRWELSNRGGWAVQQQLHSVTLGTDSVWNWQDDAATYRMPWCFDGHAAADRWYDTEGGYEAAVIPVNRLERLKSISYETETSNRPDYAAFRRIPVETPTSEQATGWIVEFWPRPTGNSTYTIAYHAGVTGMVHDDDTFFAGYPYDRSLEALCVLEASIEAGRDESRTARYEAEAQRALAEALEHDARSRPVIAGQRNPHPAMPPDRIKAKSLTINGHFIGNVST